MAYRVLQTGQVKGDVDGDAGVRPYDGEVGVLGYRRSTDAFDAVVIVIVYTVHCT